jgi:ribosomal protein S18 acetylase RimI-like enzyme
MQIITYHQLKDKTDLFLLWAKSFGWLCTPKQMDHWVKIDERLIGTPVGVCAIIDGNLAGFVGIMEIPTRNKHGETEIVGGIWAVATRPSFARQGVGGRLLEAAENHFRQKGFRLSMLTTSRAFIAHRGYVSFGYREVEIVNNYPHFYKVPRRSAKADPFPPEPKEKAVKLDLGKIGRLFENYTRNRCGFTIREIGTMQERQDMGFYFEPRSSVVLDDGYLLAGKQMGSVWISEVIASSQKTARELLRRSAATSTAGIFARSVFDPEIARLLGKLGYRRDPGAYGVLMAKPLTDVPFDDIYDDTFLFTAVESI